MHCRYDVMAPTAAMTAMNGAAGEKSPAPMSGNLKGLENQLSGLSMAGSSSSSTIPAQTSSVSSPKEASDSVEAVGQAGSVQDVLSDKASNETASGHSISAKSQELPSEQGGEAGPKRAEQDHSRGSPDGRSHVANGKDAEIHDCSGSDSAQQKG